MIDFKIDDLTIGVKMQLTVDISDVVAPYIQTMATQSGQSEQDIVNSLLMNYFLSKSSLGQGWQQMYEALYEFEPDFVLKRENAPEQLRQEWL